MNANQAREQTDKYVKSDDYKVVSQSAVNEILEHVDAYSRMGYEEHIYYGLDRTDSTRGLKIGFITMKLRALGFECGSYTDRNGSLVIYTKW